MKALTTLLIMLLTLSLCAEVEAKNPFKKAGKWFRNAGQDTGQWFGHIGQEAAEGNKTYVIDTTVFAAYETADWTEGAFNSTENWMEGAYNSTTNWTTRQDGRAGNDLKDWSTPETHIMNEGVMWGPAGPSVGGVLMYSAYWSGWGVVYGLPKAYKEFAGLFKFDKKEEETEPVQQPEGYRPPNAR